MNAIVPLNVAALRVSTNDASNVVVGFKGRVANFDNVPWQSGDQRASTGATVAQPLESTSTALDPLGAGIHVHWELPDYFRRGVQQPDSDAVVFPQVPNRWMVTRWLSLWDGTAWGAPVSHAWIVESDYIAPALLPDGDGVLRPAAPVPLPSVPAAGQQPYRYMGRVVDASQWNPSGEEASSYLPAFTGADGKPLYLTANGFLGPGFAAYYPDCSSVFGFWDRFVDLPQLQGAIRNNQPVQFRATYQVVGWIDPGAPDPLDDAAEEVARQYDDYVARCAAQRVAVQTTPADVFTNWAQQQMRWLFDPAAVGYTLNEDGTLATLDVPARTLCAGTLQEVVWSNLDSPGTTYFLNDPENRTQPWLWSDVVEVAVGNTPVEALSALLKEDMGNTDDDPDLLDNYELLLDALQLGMLRELESADNRIIELEEALHSSGFAQTQGGLLWVVQEAAQQSPGTAPTPDAEITLPPELAEQLSALNAAQKAYDMAREAVEIMRKQLFMDWYRYVNIYAGGVPETNVTVNTLANFLTNSGGSALTTVVDAGTAAGILTFVQDPDTGSVTGVEEPTGSRTESAAYGVWTALSAFRAALRDHPGWEMVGVPAPPFWQPTDPTVLVEGDRIEPVRRNGTAAEIAARVTAQLLDTLSIGYGGAAYPVAASSIRDRPPLPPALPHPADTAALVGEAQLITPMLAGGVAEAMSAAGAPGNPATADPAGFVTSLQAMQGGLSPLEGGPGAGLFAAVRADGYVAAANPARSVEAPMALTATFTNGAGNGWAPDAVGWSAQQAYPEFTQTRVDPFLPVSIIWRLRLDPLRQTGAGGYAADNLTEYFALDADGVDYQYLQSGGAPVAFTTGTALPYGGSVVLNKKPVFSLTKQIDSYIGNYPDDPADPTLREIQAAYDARSIMAQAASGFGVQQNLADYLAQITVEDFTRGGRDTVTTAIAQAAGATPGDDWYDGAFNSRAPIATGPLAGGFGPLRAGYVEVLGLEVVDVFGQRMDLTTEALNADGSLQVTAALTVQPQPDDTAHAGMVYLPPRLLAPTRLWFRWLSASHGAGRSGDFVEMNTHPATSPVCGWVLPNHLDGSLFFYDAPGTPIGSFGVEHGDLVYRTRAGNLANPASDLALDIGARGAADPPVNTHVAAFMWHVDAQDAAFLTDLAAAILASDAFISPAGSAQDASLAVLIGQPLAITRAVLGMETAGNLLPLSQADVRSTDPWPQDVNAGRYAYTDRMDYSSAALGSVQFPTRLGDLANIDDGLVGYFVEGTGTDPYGTFYAPAGPPDGNNGVRAPAADTVSLTLNATPLTLTLLVDPRAAVHATAGVLPVEELGIPPDQYSESMRNLQMTFATLPVLNERQGLVLPLPAESGYVWSWVPPGDLPEVPLAASAANGNAVWDFSPQKVLEGWLKLSPSPDTLTKRDPGGT